MFILDLPGPAVESFFLQAGESKADWLLSPLYALSGPHRALLAWVLLT